MAIDLAKQRKWKETERLNARHALAKVSRLLPALGFTPVKGQHYRIEVNSKTCNLGISKLTLTPTLRIYGSVEGDGSNLLTSDVFTYKGHPSGLKFSLAVSRFKDNSDECAEQVVAFVKSVALPWFRDHTS